MSQKTKRLVAAAIAAVSLAAVPSVQAITTGAGVRLACQAGGSGCIGRQG